MPRSAAPLSVDGEGPGVRSPTLLRLRYDSCMLPKTRRRSEGGATSGWSKVLPSLFPLLPQNHRAHDVLLAVLVVIALMAAACSEETNAKRELTMSDELGTCEQFLTATYLPVGFQKDNEILRTDASGVTSLSVSYQVDASDRRTLWIQQQCLPGGNLPAQLKTNNPVSVGPNQGYRATNNAGNKHSINWAHGDLIVTVTGTDISFDEVLQVAASMQ